MGWRNHCHSAAKPDRARRHKCELGVTATGTGSNYFTNGERMVSPFPVNQRHDFELCWSFRFRWLFRCRNECVWFSRERHPHIYPSSLMAQMAISPRRFPLRQLLLNRPPWTAWWLLLTGFEPQRRRDRMGEHDGERHQQTLVTGTGQLAGNPISMAPISRAASRQTLINGWILGGKRKSLGAERMATCSFDRSQRRVCFC